MTKLAIAGLKDYVTKNLKMRVELSVGMKAMVVLNIATDADIANGTRRTVEGFVLDPREKSTTPDEDDGCIRLQYPPPVIYFKPYSHKTMSFEGEPVGIIPISPLTVRFSVERDGEKVKLERRQLALVPGYAFTDYKAQGQTMECVIADVSKPPSGALLPFSVYVALSRSRGRRTIRILRPRETSTTLFSCITPLKICGLTWKDCRIRTRRQRRSTKEPKCKKLDGDKRMCGCVILSSAVSR